VREALRHLGLKTEDTTASVQGFGNVAQYAIRLYNQLGGKVVCVSCWDHADQKSYSFRKDDGIVLDDVLAITDRFGGIDKNKARDLGIEVLDGGAWIEQEVDILIPAALENQITAATAPRMSKKVRLIAEGANGPTTPEADAVIQDRGQCNTNYYWEKQEVLDKLDLKMTSAFHAVNDLSIKRKLYMRDAAYVIAIGRVAQACRDRGWA